VEVLGIEIITAKSGAIPKQTLGMKFCPNAFTNKMDLNDYDRSTQTPLERLEN